MPAAATQRRDAELGAIEYGSRTLKTDLGIRPVYHWTGRVGRDACNRRLGNLSQWKMQKHFHFTFAPDSRPLHWARDEESIARAAATDGLYVVRTSRPESCLSAADTVRAYKDLRHVEWAFQSLQSMLWIRSIRHGTETRVRAHVFLCMLAYYVTWHLRAALRPVLFDNPAPATPPVAPR